MSATTALRYRAVGLWSGLIAWAITFAGILLADHPRYYRYTGHAVYHVRYPGLLTEMGLVQSPAGRWTMSARLGDFIVKRLSDTERHILITDETQWGRAEETAAADALSRLCEFDWDGTASPLELSIRWSSSDRLLVSRLSVVGNEMNHYGFRARIEEQMRAVEALELEVLRLGAPPELRARLREANTMGGLESSKFSLKGGFPVIGTERRILWFRFWRSAWGAFCAAGLAGLVVGCLGALGARLWTRRFGCA